MLDRDEEAMSACSVVTRLSPNGSGTLEIWLRGRDLNPRPLGYEPNELPDCSTPRHLKNPQSTTPSCTLASDAPHTVCRTAHAHDCKPRLRNGTHPSKMAEKPAAKRRKRAGMRLAFPVGMNVIGELLLVTSSVAVSLAVSRLALNELFRLVRITARPPHDPAAR